MASRNKAAKVRAEGGDDGPPPRVEARPANMWWDVFFRDQRAPVLRSQLVTAIMAGRQLEVDRLPAAALLDAVLLAMAAREYHESEIVDDFQALLRRTDAVWSDPAWSCRVFAQRHDNAANFVIKGMTRFSCVEDQYIPHLVGWMLSADPPEYFEEELAA